MRVAVIGSAGIPASYGGFETLVENLVKTGSGNIQYTVFCSTRSVSRNRVSFPNVILRYLDLSANGLQSILYDVVSMWLSLRSDVLLILGVSGCLALPILRLFFRGRIITNVDGVEWRRQKWSRLASLFLRLSEFVAVHFSDVTIADNEGIRDHIAKSYRRKSVVVAYGGDHVLGRRNPMDVATSRVAVSVCRIEPENSIHVILEAFEKQPDWNLVLVGNWDASPYGKALYRQYSGYENIRLLQPVYDSRELAKIRGGADLYIHGHSAGGTNPSLVEAMYIGLPILAFDCSYNRYTTQDEGVYWADALELKDGLQRLTPDLLRELGSSVQRIADTKYRWSVIVKKYETLYGASV